MMETIAGIDPSTKPGICIMEDGKVIHAAGDSVTGKGWPRGKTNSAFRIWLRSALIAHHVDAFAFELPIMAGKIESAHDTHSQASYFWETAQALAHELNIEVVGVAIQSWRSVFFGSAAPPKAPPAPDHILEHRRASWQQKWRRDWWKQRARVECEKRGIRVNNDDGADAVGICHWLYAQRHPMGWAGANALFDLPQTKPARPAGMLSLRSEAERLFAPIGESSG